MCGGQPLVEVGALLGPVLQAPLHVQALRLGLAQLRLERVAPGPRLPQLGREVLGARLGRRAHLRLVAGLGAGVPGVPPLLGQIALQLPHADHQVGALLAQLGRLLAARVQVRLGGRGAGLGEWVAVRW